MLSAFFFHNDLYLLSANGREITDTLMSHGLTAINSNRRTLSQRLPFRPSTECF